MNQESKTTTIGVTSSEKRQKELQQTKSEVRKPTDDLASAVEATPEEYRGKAKQIWADVSQRTRTFQKDSEQYVRQNPTKTIISALGIGLVLGLTFRR